MSAEGDPAGGDRFGALGRPKRRERILVIRPGPLTGFVQAAGALQQIRAGHPGAEITLLTTPPLADLARAMGLFDLIESDARPAGLAEDLALVSRLRKRRYRRVYDLQTDRRRGRLFWWLLPFPPAWLPAPDGEPAPIASMAWAAETEEGREATPERFGLSPPFALLVPGGPAARRWPVERYARLARELGRRGIQTGVIGEVADAPLAARIGEEAKDAADLTGRLSLVELATLGSRAALCVGGDVGLTHLIAHAGAPGAMLYSRPGDEARKGPRAPMTALEPEDLSALPVEAVIEACLGAHTDAAKQGPEPAT